MGIPPVPTTWCAPTRWTPGLGAGVVRVKGTDRALALSVDATAATAISIRTAEPSSPSPKPLATSPAPVLGRWRDQLPELRQSRTAGNHVAVRQAVEGIGAACRALDVPITGGNVSLYNETDGRAIYPTPVIGVVGCSSTPIAWSAARFQRSGDASCCSETIAGSLAAANTSR